MPQPFPKAAQPEARREGLARFFEDGQLDLSYFLENPRGFLLIPVVVTEPAVGDGGGLAGMFVRPRKEAADEGWARPTSPPSAGSIPVWRMADGSCSNRSAGT